MQRFPVELQLDTSGNLYDCETEDIEESGSTSPTIMGSPTGPSRVVILTDSPTAVEDEMDLPKRAASTEPDSNTTKG